MPHTSHLVAITPAAVADAGDRRELAITALIAIAARQGVEVWLLLDRDESGTPPERWTVGAVPTPVAVFAGEIRKPDVRGWRGRVEALEAALIEGGDDGTPLPDHVIVVDAALDEERRRATAYMHVEDVLEDYDGEGGRVKLIAPEASGMSGGEVAYLCSLVGVRPPAAGFLGAASDGDGVELF